MGSFFIFEIIAFIVEDMDIINAPMKLQIVREVIVGDKKADPVKLDAVVLSRSNLMLFTAGFNGTIFSVKYPLTDPVISNEYHVHNGDITHVSLVSK